MLVSVKQFEFSQNTVYYRRINSSVFLQGYWHVVITHSIILYNLSSEEFPSHIIAPRPLYNPLLDLSRAPSRKTLPL